ncbi:MAG TPA: hypothetical protein VHV55_11395 [Pirellulales bacterium]|jgi:hypothetical protein|nr:hypothetical protein [Pirellulales bacterium]
MNTEHDMDPDWFQQLAEVDVPPVPAHFDHEVRRRVNNALLAVQLIELATKGFLYACGEFSRALVDLLTFSVSGKFSSDRRKRH